MKKENIRTERKKPGSEQDIKKAFAALRARQNKLEKENRALQEKQTKLEASLNAYADLCENAPTGYVSLDAEGRILQANRTASRLLKQKKASLLKKRFHSFVMKEDHDIFATHIRKTFRTGKEVVSDLRLGNKKGTSRHALLRSIVMKDQRARRNIAITSISDISAFKDMERVLQVSESRYRGLVDNALVAIFQSNIKGDILFANNAMARMFEFKSAHQVKSLKAFSFYKDPQKRKAMLKELKRQGRLNAHELELKTRTGKTRYALSSVTLTGDILTGAMVDITEQKLAEEALRETELEYARFLDSTLVGVLRTNIQGEILFANKALARMFGFRSPEELMSINIISLYPDKNIRKKMLQALKAKGKLKYFEVPFKSKSGKIKHYLFNTVLKDNLITSIGFDITELKEAQQALEESEEKHRILIENSLVGFVIYDKEKIHYANPALMKILDMSIKKLATMPLKKAFEFVHPEDRAFVMNNVRKRLSGKPVPARYSFRIQRKDTSIRWVEVSAGLFRYHGNPAVHAVFVDITDNKKAEALIRESEIRYRQLVESSPMPIIVHYQGKAEFVNPSALKLMGAKSLSDLLGRPVLDFVHPDFRETVGKRIKQIYEKKIATVRLDEKIFRLDGRELDIEATGSLVMYEGKPCVQVILNDITDRKKAEAMLKASEEKYRTLIDHSLQGVVILQNNQIVFANPALAKMCGYTVRELTSFTAQQVTELIHPEDQELVWGNLKKRLTGEKIPPGYKFRIIRKDGVVRWWEIYVTIIHVDGKPAIQATTLDITERKLAEEALRESEARFRTAVESLPFDFFILDKDGRYVMQNAACKKRWGDIIGKRPKDVVGDKATGARWEINNQRAFEGNTVRGEVSLARRGKKEFYYNIISPIFDEKNVRGILGVNIDITERKLAEEQLRESEERFRAIFENAKDGILLLDMETEKFHSGNQMICRMLKATAAKIKQMGIEHILPKKSAAAVLKELKNQLRGGFALDKDLQIGWKGGPSFYANLSAFPITLAGRTYMVLVVRDITEKKILEEEMLKTDKLESVGKLAGGIAHDFNNILTGILGNITMARIFVKPEEKAFKHLERAEKASWRGQNLTQQLLTFSKGGAPVKKVISIGELVMESARFASTGSNITCRFDISEDLWPVEADAGQMTQVISNLVINADQAMPAGGEVLLHAENITLPERGRVPLKAGFYVKIIVKDQGIGIPKQHHSRVFDPYFSTKQKGSGLGLTTAYSILKNHEGLITLASKQGKGASFTIYLPASPEKMPQQKGREAEPISGEGRILVLDDDPEVSEVVQSMLRDLGYEVELASKSRDAIDRYSAARKSGRPFAAVILDLTMPGDQGGKEVIKELRRIDPGIKAVVSSGYSDDPVLANCSKYGFRAALVKPFKTRHLGKALHQAIKGAGK